jgi:hypothetical protein
MTKYSQDLINIYKDILYLIGSVLGIIGFVRTLKKIDYCTFNYRTDFGNEVEPYLICLKGNIYNLQVSNKQRAVFVHKYPASIPPLHEHRTKLPAIVEHSSFFPILKEQEFILVENHKLDMENLLLHYEDKYSNRYRQVLRFDKAEIGNDERIKRTNRSCYVLSKRKLRFLGLWIPYN